MMTLRFFKHIQLGGRRIKEAVSSGVPVTGRFKLLESSITFGSFTFLAWSCPDQPDAANFHRTRDSFSLIFERFSAISGQCIESVSNVCLWS